jgi:hypothetical protein
VWVRDSTWVFAWLEVFHLLGLTVLLGTVLVLSLRLAGLIMKHQPVAQLAREMSSLTSVALALMLVTGYLMFSAEAIKCFESEPFRLKMVFLFLAILFHFTLYRKISRTNEDRFSPVLGKLAAGIALILWFGVGAAGRSIAFF